MSFCCLCITPGGELDVTWASQLSREIRKQKLWAIRLSQLSYCWYTDKGLLRSRCSCSLVVKLPEIVVGQRNCWIETRHQADGPRLRAPYGLFYCRWAPVNIVSKGFARNACSSRFPWQVQLAEVSQYCWCAWQCQFCGFTIYCRTLLQRPDCPPGEHLEFQLFWGTPWVCYIPGMKKHCHPVLKEY